MSLTYLNHAGTSWPKPAPVHRAVARALEAGPREWPALFERARARVAEFIGAAPEDVLITSGCTSALAVAVSSVPVGPGDRVLTSGLEHHALMGVLETMSKRSGAELLVAPYQAGRPIELDFVARELARGDVRLVAATMASNVTGERTPARALVELAHEHGALCLLDAAQAVGVQPVDARALGVDMLAFAGHKGPQGPHGIGALYVAPGVALDARASSCDVTRPDARAACGRPGYCDVGSVNYAALAGLAAGLEWIEARGVEAIAAHGEALVGRLLGGLSGLGDRVRVLGGSDPRSRVPVVAFVPRDVPGDTVAQRLREDHGILARAGYHCAPRALETLGAAETGAVRLSAGAVTTAACVDAAIAALRTILTS